MNWKRVLLPTGSVAAMLALLILIARGCQEVYYSEMEHVQAGQFEMGCADCQDFEKPVHTVKLDGFWIDKYETTFGRYANFLNNKLASGSVQVVERERNDGSKYSEVWIDGVIATYLYPLHDSQLLYADGVFTVNENKQDFPVPVTWSGAQAYCKALKKRLPTEAEWEYAAKGGHLSRFVPGEVNYFRYSGSDDPNIVAWHPDNSDERSHPVGQKSPNELGIFDMSGNLREWVNDWYDPDYYSYSPQIDPQGPMEKVSFDCLMPDNSYHTFGGKVLRGGSFLEGIQPCSGNEDINSSIDPSRVRVTKRDFG